VEDDSRKSILIVEDDAVIGSQEKRLLENAGYLTVHLLCGEDALERARNVNVPIDLILIDIDLGRGMDGAQTAREILRLREIPILFLFSHAEAEYVGKTKDIQSYGCVPKDAGFSVIESAVRTALRLSAKAGESTAAETNLRTLFNTIDEMVFLFDHEGRIIRANETVTARLGYTYEDIVGKGIEFLHGLEHGEEAAKIVRRMASAGPARNAFHAIPLFAKDGRVIEAETKMTNGTWDGRDVVIAVSRDITDRVIAERMAKLSDERFRKIFHANPGPILISEIDTGTHIDVNEEYCRLVGFTHDELIGYSSVELGIWNTNDNRRFFIGQLRNTGSLRDLHVKIHTRSGATRDVLWSAEIIMLNGKEVLLSLLHDITGSLRIERELRASERKYRDLINGMKETVWILGFDGQIIEVNNSAVETLGYTREELRGISLYEIDSTLSREEINALIESIPADKIQVFETSHRRKDGTTFRVEICSSIVFFQGRQAILSIARDITNRKASEMRIRNLLEEKEAILKEVHHRIRNNMNTIYSLLSLQARTQENPEVSRVLLDAAERIPIMQAIYNRLYCYGEGKGFASIREYFGSLIPEIMAIFPRSGSIRIETKLDDSVLAPKILSSLGIIVNELFTNSMKYAFADRDEGTISLTVSAKDGRLLFIYEDNGPGIPENVSPENSPGFGLSLVSILVSQISGSLRIDRSKGASFIIEARITNPR
jgi:PAS domain S-box-containing protein